MNFYNNILLIGNALLYLVTFIYLRRKEQNIGAGSLIILYYFFIAFVSIFLFNHPLSEGFFLDLKLFPYIYLYVMLLLACYPIIRFSRTEVENITLENHTALNVICYIIIISTLLYVPKVIQDLTQGISTLFFDPDGGSDLYKESYEKFDQAGKSVSNIPAIIIGAFSDLSILFFFFYLTLKERKKIIIIGLTFSVFMLMVSSISEGERGDVVTKLITFIFTFILMKQFLSEKIRKYAFIAIFTGIGIMVIPISFITISRFSQQEFDDDFVSYSVEYYFAQAPLNFNNYGLDPGGCRYGDRTATLVKRIVSSDSPQNYSERMDKYSYMNMSENIFYTFIGDFTLDYGPILAVVIILGFSMFVLFKTQIGTTQTLLFHQLILLYLLMCICVQGAFTLFSFSDIGGNLRFILTLFLYLYFKIDYLKNKQIIL